jgi:hypothetical protein
LEVPILGAGYKGAKFNGQAAIALIALTEDMRDLEKTTERVRATASRTIPTRAPPGPRFK